MKHRSSAARHAALGLGLAALLAAAACGNEPSGSGGDSGGEDPAATPGVPTAFAAVDDTVRDGFHRVTCDTTGSGRKKKPLVDDQDRTWAVHLVVPDSFDHTDTLDGRCTYSKSFAFTVSVTFAPTDTVADYDEKNVSIYLGDQGDDSVSDIEYDVSAPVFGGLEGELLTWYSFNDGYPFDEMVMQANGLRVQVAVAHEGPDRAEQIQVVLDSISLEQVKSLEQTSEPSPDDGR